MNTYHKTIAISLLTLVWGAASAQQAPDTSSWVCEFCPPAESQSGSFSLGVGWVDDLSYKFEDFTGLDEGGYLVAGGSALRTTETDYWRFDAHQLGLRSREIAVDGGKPGSYRLRLAYVELPQFITDSARSIYPNAGDGSLVLPAGWVSAPNTQGMTALDASLRPLRLRQDRERFDVGVALTPPGRWRYKVDYSHELKEGVRAIGGGFLFTSSLLPTPVDYVTDQVDVSAVYAAEKWQAELSYYGSFFNNDEDRLTWENAFNPLFPGAAGGQLALAPDNEFHRLGLAGTYRAGERTRLTGSIGIGRMLQDDDYLPYTVNVGLPAAPLPLNSLDGEVDVIDLIARLDSRLGARTRVEVQYRYYERDNDSSVAAYQPVTMDLFVNEPRLNRPYSYDRQTLNAEASYRLNSAVRIAAGVEYEQFERSRAEASDTDEGSAWARLRLGLGQRIDANIRLNYSDRNGDDIDPAAELAATENPLLRKYHYADRERQEVRAMITLSLLEDVQLTLGGGYAEDDYDQSILGLNDSEYQDVSIDLSIAPNEKGLLHAFYTLENIETEVSNNEALTGTDWFGDTEDTIQSFGAGIEFRNIKDKKIDLSVDYVYSRAEGEYRIDDGRDAAPFPDLTTRLEGVRVRLNYPLRGGAELVLDYYNERFRSSDWALDGVDPDEIFNFLSLGEVAPRYNVDSVAIFYRKTF